MSITITYPADLPEWAQEVSGIRKVTSVDTIFFKLNPDISYPSLEFKCDDNCGAKMRIDTFALLHFPGGYAYENKCVLFQTEFPEEMKKKGKDKIFTIDITKAGVAEKMIEFIQATKKVSEFKMELLTGMEHLLEFGTRDIEPQIQFECILRRRSDCIEYLLFEVSSIIEKLELDNAP